MNEAMFGWIFQPLGLEDDPCPLCGNAKRECSCQPCGHPVSVDGVEGTCNVQGCLTHLSNRELVARMENLEKQFAELRNEATRREVPTLPCPECGEVQVVNIFNSGPYSCHGYFYAGDTQGWIRKGMY